MDLVDPGQATHRRLPEARLARYVTITRDPNEGCLDLSTAKSRMPNLYVAQDETKES